MYISTAKSYGPDDIIAFDASSTTEADALSVDIAPLQDLNGYAHPWAAGAGKNIYDYSNYRPAPSGLTVSLSDEGIFTISGLPTANYVNLVQYLDITDLLEDGETYTISKSDYSTGNAAYVQVEANRNGTRVYYWTNRGPASFTVDKSGSEVSYLIYVQTGTMETWGSESRTVSFGVQLEKGATATSWEPYSNVCPISGWSEVNVQRTGTNLCDEQWEDGYISSDGYLWSYKDAIRSKNFNPCAPNTPYYYVLGGTSSGYSVAWYDRNKEFILRSFFMKDMTSPSNAYFFKCSLYNYKSEDAPEYAHDISVSYPPTTRDYASYQGEQYTTQLGQTVYGGTLNVLTGKLTVTKGYIASYNGEELNTPWISSLDGYAIGATPTTGAQVVYDLETPTTVQLTGHQITLRKGANTMFADAGDISLKFTDITYEGDSIGDIYRDYLSALEGDFVKLAKLEFLNPGGDVAFALDNNPLNKRSGAFIQSGTISCNLQNGRRRQAQVTLHNLDHAYEFAVNHIWFGQQLRLSEGLILPDGTEFYIPQGVFEIETPAETLKPGQRTVTYSLVDKWANLDGTHFGNLEDVYSVVADTNILDAIAAALKLDKYGRENLFSISDAVNGYIINAGTSIASDSWESMTSAFIPVTPGTTYTYTVYPTTEVSRWTAYAFYSAEDMSTIVGSRSNTSAKTTTFTAPTGAAYVRICSRRLQNGGNAEFVVGSGASEPIDDTAPLFTNYYNDKTQTLTDGTVVSLIQAPYDFLSASTGTLAEVVLGLVEMIAGDVGYNQTGRLVVNPSQDDIADQDKPILWEFTENSKTFLGADYTPKPADVYNDVIVVGATSDDNITPRGRAQNLDPTSDTCVSRIGRKTIRLEMPNYYSDTICQDYAMWQLKRYTTMSKEVTIQCTQMFHIVENQLITLQRQDKPGSPIERHVVQGFSRPIGQTGTMTINCISTEDYPNATLVESDYTNGGD